jgi:hypothetical protein
MDPLKFNVKDKSLHTFFGIESKGRDSVRQDINPYYLMKDEIIIPKRPELSEVGIVIFELSDTSEGSRKELVNVYSYQINEYDDVSIKLNLVDFKIETR